MSSELHELSFLVTTHKLDGQWVLFNWLSMSYVAIADERHPVYVALEHGRRQLCRDDFGQLNADFVHLCDQKFLVRNQNEIEQLVVGIYRRTHSEADLTMTLMPSGFLCNFRCAYCNQPHKSARIMGAVDQNILLNFLSSLCLSSLRVDYFGGEALLNSDFIVDFNTKLTNMSKTKSFGFLGSSITTNGYLLNRSLFRNLIGVGVTSYQVTLDGLKEDHDVLRQTAKGHGSHDVIFANLKEVLADRGLAFSITLRMNLGPSNSAGDKLNEWIECLKRAVGLDDRVVIQVQAIGNWKEEPDNRRLYFDQAMSKAVQHQVENEFEKAGFNILRAAIYGSYEAHHCYSSKSNNIIVFPAEERSGAWAMPVEKCTFYTKMVKNCVGFLDSNGIFQRDGAWDAWVTNTPFSREECRRCFFVLNCFGSSCSLNNQIQGGTVCPDEKREGQYEVIKIMNHIRRNKPGGEASRGTEF